MQFCWRNLEGKNVRVLSLVNKGKAIDIGAIDYKTCDRRWHLILKDRRGHGISLKAKYESQAVAEQMLAMIWRWERLLKDVSTEKWQQK